MEEFGSVGCQSNGTFCEAAVCFTGFRSISAASLGRLGETLNRPPVAGAGRLRVRARHGRPASSGSRASTSGPPRLVFCGADAAAGLARRLRPAWRLHRLRIGSRTRHSTTSTWCPEGARGRAAVPPSLFARSLQRVREEVSVALRGGGIKIFSHAPRVGAGGGGGCAAPRQADSSARNCGCPPTNAHLLALSAAPSAALRNEPPTVPWLWLSC